MVLRKVWEKLRQLMNLRDLLIWKKGKILQGTFTLV